MHFLLNVNQSESQKAFSRRLSHRHNASFSSFGPCYGTKWQISPPFHSLQLVKSLPFHVPEAWKRYPFRAEPPRIGHKGALASTTATAERTSLLKWIRGFSIFVAFIPIHWKSEMWANFTRVDFLGTGLKLRKRKENSSSLVYALHKSWN